MTAEKNAEILLGIMLKNTPFANKVFSVGGFVRDEIIGINSKDLDLVVNKDGGAKEITHLLKHLLKDSVTTPQNLGNGFPIWQLTFTDDVEHNKKTFAVKGAILEFADTQKEAFPDPTTRQRIAKFGTTDEDVKRRDFTCNMLMRNVTNGEVIDLVGGTKDIKNGILRSHPEVSFDKILSDDPLRMMRMIRLKSKFGWEVPVEDLEAVKRNAHRIQIISAERIKAELEKIMILGKLSEAVRFMDEVGLLEFVFPEVHAMKGVFHDRNQNFHLECDFELFGHVMLVLENAQPGVVPQLAALMHDIGKPPTRKEDEKGRIRFNKHEPVGARMVKDVLKKMKFETVVINKVIKLVDMHTRPHTFGRDGVNTSVKAVRKLIRDAGDLLEDLLDLSEADCLGNHPVKNNIPNLRARIKEVLETTPPMESKPILNGGEIMQILKLGKGGPVVGTISKALIDLEDDFANDGKVLTKKDAEEFILTFH